MKMWHETAPHTRRPARLLSRVYGYKNVRDLADSLPEYGVVADFGSAYSNFGSKIASLRDDITWLNIDPMYARRTRRLDWIKRRAPGNLHFLAGSVLEPPLTPASCDRVFSSALLPHIMMTSEELAGEAVMNMGELLKEDGILAVSNFVNNRLTLPLSRHRGHIAVVSQVDLADSPSEVMQGVLSGMSPGAPSIQKAVNLMVGLQEGVTTKVLE